ncbi:MAG: hypothetical protein DWQ02_19310 [Bacteroidetes bacterium]|nr:MAG: hypothetical protein DWQ02_19310 [Bacteroidota bacterium]
MNRGKKQWFQMIRKMRVMLVGLVPMIFWCLGCQQNECESRVSYQAVNINDHLDLDSLFIPPDSLELSRVWEAWKSADLISDSFFVKLEIPFYEGKKMQVIEHYSGGDKHYGAVVIPADYDKTKKYPLVVWANGLDQRNPEVDALGWVVRTLNKGLEDHFLLIPSFRGQSLKTNNGRYCSDGFFGDAFDGATEDALRLLELVKGNFEGVDSGRITVCGMSRGGTVALLMAARDTTIKAAVSIAGPTFFLSKEVYNRYRPQYKYQFLSKAIPFEEIREKIIKCSPMYFVDAYPNDLLLIHGKNDEVVPLDNAEKIIDLLEGKENFESLITDDGHAFYDWQRVIDWILEYNG